MITIKINDFSRNMYDKNYKSISCTQALIHENGKRYMSIGPTWNRKVIDKLMQEQDVMLEMKEDDYRTYYLNPPIVLKIPKKEYRGCGGNEPYIYKKYFPEYNPNFKDYLESAVNSMTNFVNPDASDLLSDDALKFNQKIYDDLTEITSLLEDKGFQLEKESAENFNHRIKGPAHYLKLTNLSSDDNREELLTIGPYSSGITFDYTIL